MYIYVYVYIYLYIYIYIYIRDNIYVNLICEYHMYQFISLHSCDYLCEISLNTNVVTDEGNGRNET